MTLFDNQNTLTHSDLGAMKATISHSEGCLANRGNHTRASEALPSECLLEDGSWMFDLCFLDYSTLYFAEKKNKCIINFHCFTSDFRAACEDSPTQMNEIKILSSFGQKGEAADCI